MVAKLLEGCNIVPAFAGNIADMDTDQTGDYVSLANYGKVGILFVDGAGTAGDDPTITLYEATDTGGSGAQALAVIDRYWIKQAATSLVSVGAFTETTQTAASTIAFNATSAEQVLIAYFEVNAEELSDGFNSIRADVALAASGGAQYGAVLYMLLDPRYPQADSVSAL